MSRTRADAATATTLPKPVRDALDVALDDDAAKVARLRALATLEHTRAPLRDEVARALVPVLGHSPDVAARAHLALLVLAPHLRFNRDDHGFVVVDRGFALDELHRLFGPGDEVPAFLTPPTKEAPRPYRDPRAVRDEELAALVQQKRAAHDAFIARARDLGLDDDDLDDDVEEDPSAQHKKRRRFEPLKGGEPWATFSFVDDRDLFIDNGVVVKSLGVLRPGSWWTEATSGDHRGARRLRFGVSVDMAPEFTTRRERSLEVQGEAITLTAGHADKEFDVAGRSLAVWVDSAPAEAGGEVVGVTLTWSSWRAFVQKPDKPDKADKLDKPERSDRR